MLKTSKDERKLFAFWAWSKAHKSKGESFHWPQQMFWLEEVLMQVIDITVDQQDHKIHFLKKPKVNFAKYWFTAFSHGSCLSASPGTVSAASPPVCSTSFCSDIPRSFRFLHLHILLPCWWLLNFLTLSHSLSISLRYLTM